MSESSATILIVDDSSSARDTLTMFLHADSYRLACATNGPEALQLAVHIQPDLILLDVMMPEMDGFEVCRKIRADSRVAEVPIIMITALDDRASRLQGFEAGADDFISKPFDRTELRTRVRTITRLNRFRRLLTDRQQFEWVITHADEGYLITDSDDTIRFINHRACLLLGISAEDINKFPVSFKETALRQYRLEPETAWQSWPEQPAEDGLPFYLISTETATSPACWLQVAIHEQPSGIGHGHLVRIKDVTASIVARRGAWTFETMISHKLRTPLNGLLTSLDLIDQDRNRLPPDFGELLDMALLSTQRLKRDTFEILRYCDRKSLLQGEPFPVSNLPELTRRLGAELGLVDVALTIDPVVSAAVLTISTDALELILIELLGNARKFHPTRTPLVTVTATAAAHRVLLRISDNGITLSPEQLEKAWVPYYQGDKYFTGEVTGMGLGLSMVAALVWESGGTCRLSNRTDIPGICVEILLSAGEEPSSNLFGPDF